jgi:hypothetical protein
VEVLLRMINREPAELPLELLRPELVIRESTAMPDATCDVINNRNAGYVRLNLGQPNQPLL